MNDPSPNSGEPPKTRGEAGGHLMETFWMLESVDFYAQVAQIIAAVGVIASLFYVGVQIRQGTRATKLAAVQAVEEAIGRTEQMIIQDREFAELVRRGMTASGGELPDTDRIRINVLPAPPSDLPECVLPIQTLGARSFRLGGARENPRRDLPCRSRLVRSLRSREIHARAVFREVLRETHPRHESPDSHVERPRGRTRDSGAGHRSDSR